MSNWESIIYGIILLGIIISFHEFGHFILAKANGIDVTEFMVGLGPVIFEKTSKKGTRYTFRCIPFGGACIMKGNDGGFSENVESAEDGEETEVSPELKEEEPGSFLSKNVWRRISVIFAGPFFNFLLAFVFAVIVIGFVGIDKPVIQGILDDLPAKEAGLKEGDVLVSVNGTRIMTTSDLTLYMDDYKGGEMLDLVIRRDGEEMNVELMPVYASNYEKFMLGISWGKKEKVSSFEAIGYAVNEVAFWIKLSVKSLGMLFSGKASVNDIGGPVAIVDIVDETVSASKESGFGYVILNLLNLCILLSANLGIMNLLPIPALDGGKLLFLFIEAIIGRPLDKKKEGYVTLAGMIFLLLLSLFVMFNDFRRLIFGA